jgi:hypothetical protein
MGRFVFFFSYKIFYRSKKRCFLLKPAEQIMQKESGCGFAFGSGNPYKFKIPAVKTVKYIYGFSVYPVYAFYKNNRGLQIKLKNLFLIFQVGDKAGDLIIYASQNGKNIERLAFKDKKSIPDAALRESSFMFFIKIRPKFLFSF